MGREGKRAGYDMYARSWIPRLRLNRGIETAGYTRFG